MARAIVTFARSWHALAMTRSLGRQGIEVFCGEEARFAPCFFSKYCKGSFQYPSVTQRPGEFIDFMVEKVKELKPPGDEPYVLMPMHKETWLIAEHRERFEPHISVPLTSLENMARTHDKGQLAVLAEQMGITIPATRNNLGWLLGWPMRLAEQAFGSLDEIDSGTVTGAIRYTIYHGLNLLYLYVVAAVLMRQRPSEKQRGSRL